MKNLKKALIIAQLSIIMTQFSFGDNTNNPHNVSSDDWENKVDNCKLCHSLETSIGSNIRPVWGDIKATKTFTVYNSQTLDAIVNQPDGITLMCLSCHDGSIASDNLGTDLSNDHPVSFEYNSGLAMRDKGLHDPSSTMSGLGGTIEKDLLKSGKVQCTSCHNPHHLDNGSNLKITNEKSELCLKCHEK